MLLSQCLFGLFLRIFQSWAESESMLFERMLLYTQEVNSGDVVDILWHDSSIIDTTVSNMSESEIIGLLENGEGIGMGEHFLQISVDVNKGNCADQIRETNDNDELVSYTWELISLEYEIEAVE